MKLVKEYEVRQEHTSENLSNISSFSTSVNASFTSATFADKSIFTKNETQPATKSIKKKRDRSSTKSVTESAKKKRDRFKKKIRS